MEIKKGRYSFLIDTKRFLIIAVCLMLIFFTIIGFFWWKTEEVSNSPCAICAKRIGETVTCSSPEYSNIIMYHPNLSVQYRGQYSGAVSNLEFDSGYEIEMP